MNDLFDLHGRTALISGGGTGLGRAFAHTLSDAGATVMLCARRIGLLEEAADQIRARGGKVKCIAMDVTDADSIGSALLEVARNGRIDILVNNAGVVSDRFLVDETEAGWDRIFNANLKGAWMLARSVAKQMAADRRGGSIINIASILGFTIQKALAPYGASKSALIHLTQSMAVEWARDGVRVNAIAPGYYRTDMAESYLDSEAGQRMIMRSPMRRLGKPEELAGAILLLGSDAGTYMTGSLITVDGGVSIPFI